ncbi:hypothetical protein BG015_001228 [Linnemannia schmuckeri]|uniref:Uncharacterized protein n=1 Tax=Linnemannia schmuckeri TaxID=64567 RepID=A0A9P5V728_9FUNG|nr:hypothetical protein BG015_001228 [Linnemannia schmuckeri]
MNLFFLVLDLLVAAAFAAALAHISRRVGGHTHSIRWIKQAGVLEMATALYYSFRKVTGRLWLALLATFLGTFALSGILVGVKSFANIATAEGGHLSTEVVVSEQFLSANLMPSLPEWSFPVGYTTSMEDALARAFNNTKINPRADPKKRYRPRLSEYELACDRLDVRVLFQGTIHIPNGGCANLTISPGNPTAPKAARLYIRQGTMGRATVVMPLRAEPILLNVEGTVGDVSLIFRVDHSDHISVSADVSQKLLNNEVVAGMQELVNNGTLTNLPADPLEQVIVMEVKIAGTEVTTLTCSGSRHGLTEPVHIACVYSVTNILILKARPINSDIVLRLPDKVLHPELNSMTIMMTLTHHPFLSADKGPVFAISKILNSSSVAAAYLASLGQNFILDWEGPTAYIVYETVDILKGYEIPAGLFYSMIGVMVICLLFCAATEYWVEGRYKRSLYWQVAQSLAPSGKKASPQLHRFDTVELEFEGRRIVSTKVPQMSEEAKMYQRSIPGSQDPLVAVL